MDWGYFFESFYFRQLLYFLIDGFRFEDLKVFENKQVLAREHFLRKIPPRPSGTPPLEGNGLRKPFTLLRLAFEEFKIYFHNYIAQRYILSQVISWAIYFILIEQVAIVLFAFKQALFYLSNICIWRKIQSRPQGTSPLEGNALWLLLGELFVAMKVQRNCFIDMKLKAHQFRG